MAQRDHWNKVYGSEPDFFGEGPSDCARIALDLFRENQVGSVLELGCGQGRDSLLFARNGLEVTALDYSETAVSAVRERAGSLGLSSLVRAQTCNVKEPLPFADQTFDACYSHMLLCMELSTAEIAFILREIAPPPQARRTRRLFSPQQFRQAFSHRPPYCRGYLRGGRIRDPFLYRAENQKTGQGLPDPDHRTYRRRQPASGSLYSHDEQDRRSL